MTVLRPIAVCLGLLAAWQLLVLATGVPPYILPAPLAVGLTWWNATDQLMRHIVAYLRADVALLRPTWFTVLSGITV